MIEIEHNRREGTLVNGTAKGDGAGLILRARNFRYSSLVEAWYLPHSRQRHADLWTIDRTATDLREAGFDVETAVDDLTPGRPFAEVEAEKLDLAEFRTDRYAAYAANAAARAEAKQSWADERRSHIPLGQPILIGHHSEGRDRRFRARLDNADRKAAEERRKAGYWDGRALAAGAYEAGRYNLPTTVRRIDRIGAERRSLQRTIDGLAEDSPRRAVYLVDLAYMDEELEFWEEVVAAAEAAGAKVWRKADFTKGDFVRFSGSTWYEVLRANAKTLTIPSPDPYGREAVITRASAAAFWGSNRTATMPYDKVTGRMSAAEAAERLGTAQQS